MSLCFLLALVVMLMQKAADPRHVRNAFQALGVPLDDAAERGGDSPDQVTLEPERDWSTLGNSSAQPDSAPTDRAMTDWEMACRDLVARMLDELTETEIAQLATNWFAAAHVPDVPGREPAVSGALETQLSALNLAERSSPILDELADETRQADISEAEKMEWLLRLEEFRQQWQQLGDGSRPSELPSALSPELQSSITHYLDQRLVATLRDATPWTQAETLPFWRLLQRGKSEKGDGTFESQHATRSRGPRISIVNTYQLAAEADALRGTTIRFRGSVRRVERSYSPLGIDGGYWIVWLRGADEAVQPVAVYTSDPRAAELAEQLSPKTIDFPPVEVEAIFAKRLAYSSASGVQVAPTLFAKELTVFRAPPVPYVSSFTDDLWRQFLIALFTACLLAAAILIPMNWQRRGRATRGRAQRKPAVERTGETRSGRIEGVVLMVVAVLYSALILCMTSAHAQPTLRNQASAGMQLAQASSATPPWANKKDAENPLQVVFVDNMQSLFSQSAADELRALRENAAAEFPNVLLKALYATRRIGWQQALQLTHTVSLAGGMKLSARTISGWVRLATPVELSESQRSWFQSRDAERLYRVEVQLQEDLFGKPLGAQGIPATGLRDEDESPELVTVYCLEVPRMWLTSAQLRQPSRFKLLAIGDAQQSDRFLCGLASRPQWLLPSDMPADEFLAPELPEHYLALGKLGWDLTNLETIANHNQQALTSNEAAGFYSLIRSLRAAPPEKLGNNQQMQPLLDTPLSILSHSQQSVGKELTWPVRIVSGTVVDVDHPEHRLELGADCYVQFDGFVDIGVDHIRFQPAPAGRESPALEFEGEFPVTIVTTLDSPLVPQEQIAAGQLSWSIGKYAIVRGRFYRMWAYQSELVKSSGQAARQIAPLVIAASITPTLPPMRDSAHEIGWFGWALCGSILVILAGILWSAWDGRGSRRVR